jgi:hypothetical protein
MDRVLPYRGFIVWGVASIVLVLALMMFVWTGWPGKPDRCVTDVPNTCFCEAFSVGDIGKPGVRQRVNTWYNLYAIFTSGLIALVVYIDRKNGPDGRNLMRSDTLVADLYIFVVLFLGLGSMWFHASLVEWGGFLDGLSMYAYAAFLPLYTLRRRIIRSPAFFWTAYAVTVAVFFVVHALLSPAWEHTSLVLIMTLVFAYLLTEVAVGISTGKALQGQPGPIALWAVAVVCIIAALVFWTLSQTGGSMCDPASDFQPHGQLWHPLAGVMAVLLYFYWRAADD